MEEILQCAMDHADETFARQIQYILEQLLSEAVDEELDEDEDEDVDVEVRVATIKTGDVALAPVCACVRVCVCVSGVPDGAHDAYGCLDSPWCVARTMTTTRKRMRKVMARTRSRRRRRKSWTRKTL
jgi:hypothetical protein